MGKYCLECGRIIPEHRIKAFPKRKIITCSKKCSIKRSLTASQRRKNG